MIQVAILMMNDENMTVLNYAEQFEEETGIKMDREVRNFHGSKMIMNEEQIIGLLLDTHTNEFEGQAHMTSDEFSLSRREQTDTKGEMKEITLLQHPDLEYELSPKWLGIIQDYLERNLGHTLVYALYDIPAPFLIRTSELCVKTNTPSVMDLELRKKIPEKE